MVDGEGHISLVGRHAAAILEDALAAAGRGATTSAAAAGEAATGCQAGLDGVDGSLLSKSSMQSCKGLPGAVEAAALSPS